MPRLREYAGFIEFQRGTTKRDGIWRKLVSRKRNGPIRAFVFLSNIRRALCVYIRYTYEQAQRAREIINAVSLKIRDTVVVYLTNCFLRSKSNVNFESTIHAIPDRPFYEKKTLTNIGEY